MEELIRVKFKIVEKCYFLPILNHHWFNISDGVRLFTVSYDDVLAPQALILLAVALRTA